jgi:dephospho-CoA kinase
MNNLIGVTGLKGSGKDTVAKIINTLHQKQYKTKRFADPLKRFVADILGVSVEKLEDREFKETILGKEWWIYQNPDTGEIYPYTDPPMFKDHHKLIKLTPRIFMQLIGTDVGRVIHPQMWVNALFSSYTKDSKWIIVDTRFDNEAKAIKDRGGIIIKVERDVGITDTHASEKGISDEYIDIVIDNNGSMEELIEKVKTALYAS